MKPSCLFPVFMRFFPRVWVHDDQARPCQQSEHMAPRRPPLRSEVGTANNLELKDEEGFLGDTRPAREPFRQLIENWRKPAAKPASDPFGDEPSATIQQEEARLSLRAEGDHEAAGILPERDRDFSSGACSVPSAASLKPEVPARHERIVLGGPCFPPPPSRVGEPRHRPRRLVIY